MSTSGRLLLLIITFLSPTAWGKSETLLDAVASAFQFPSDRLRIRDLSNSEDAKKNPKIRAVYLIDSDDNTFAQVQFLVTEPGVMFTSEVEDRFRRGLEKQAELPGAKPNIRRLQYGSGTEGYVGVLGFGPGGSTTAAVIRVPGTYDLRLTVDENPLGSSSETAAYYKAMTQNDDFLKDALGRASESIANEIVAGRLRFGEDQPIATVTASPLPSLAISSPPPAATLSPTPATIAAQSLEQTPSPAVAAPRSAHWLWWLGLAVVLLLGIVWLARKRD